MRRRVIQIADSTQLVSLPRKWAQAHGIKKGDELEVAEQGNRVIVSVDKTPQTESIEIDLSNLELMSKRIVAALYKAGYDEIKLKFSKPQELRNVQEVIKDSCIGFEIVEQGNQYIVARKISDAINDEFDSVLRRCFLFLISLTKDGLTAIKKDDVDALNNIILMDSNLNKFSDFCRRILNKQGHPKYKRIAPVYYIVEELEKIGDEYKEIHLLAVSHKIKPTKELLKVYEDLNSFLELFYETFYKFSLIKINELSVRKKSINEQISAILEKKDIKNMPAIHRLTNIADKIFNMNGALIASLM